MAEDEDNEMKDLTVTSFGLVIAYLLPGLIGLYGLSFWSKTLKNMFSTFLTIQSNVGLFLILVLAALAIGLFVNGLRWLTFEVLFFKKYGPQGSYLKALSGERKLSAYRVVIDETYRYQQWWGGAMFVIPIGYLGWLLGTWHIVSLQQQILITVLFVGIEIMCFYAALQLWIQTGAKLTHILGEGGISMGGVPSGPHGPDEPAPDHPDEPSKTRTISQ